MDAIILYLISIMEHIRIIRIMILVLIQAMLLLLVLAQTAGLVFVNIFLAIALFIYLLGER